MSRQRRGRMMAPLFEARAAGVKGVGVGFIPPVGGNRGRSRVVVKRQRHVLLRLRANGPHHRRRLIRQGEEGRNVALETTASSELVYDKSLLRTPRWSCFVLSFLRCLLEKSSRLAAVFCVAVGFQLFTFSLCLPPAGATSANVITQHKQQGEVSYWAKGKRVMKNAASYGKDAIFPKLKSLKHRKFISASKGKARKAEPVLYSTFYYAVKQGKVRVVRFDDNSPKIYFQLKSKQQKAGVKGRGGGELPAASTSPGGSWFTTKKVPSDATLLPLLVAKNVSFGTRSSVSSSIGKVMVTALVLWLPLIPLFLFIRRTIQQQQGMSKSNSKRRNLSSKNSVPGVTFKDVAGADYAIEELREVVAFLHWKQQQVAAKRREEKSRKMGSRYATSFLGAFDAMNVVKRLRRRKKAKEEKGGGGKTDSKVVAVSGEGDTANTLQGFIRMPRGVLLSGPPGTGKTLLAKAVAGEASVPFYACSASEFVELFVGRGAARVRDLFKQARMTAPSIVFIDEIDAVGGKRGAGFNEERDQTLNQLLTELDGFNESSKSANEDIVGPDVLLMCATNRPEVLDDALLRPGRLSRKVKISLPDDQGRRDIALVYLKNMPLAPIGTLPETSSDQLESGYAEMIAAGTGGCSGADIANAVNEAVLMAMRRDSDQVGVEDIAKGIQRTLKPITKNSSSSSGNPFASALESFLADLAGTAKDRVVRAQQRMP